MVLGGKVSSKYKKAVLPDSAKAVEMACEREQWAEQAVARDQLGSAREFELTALLLRFYAERS